MTPAPSFQLDVVVDLVFDDIAFQDGSAFQVDYIQALLPRKEERTDQKENGAYKHGPAKRFRETGEKMIFHDGGYLGEVEVVLFLFGFGWMMQHTAGYFVFLAEDRESGRGGEGNAFPRH